MSVKLYVEDYVRQRLSDLDLIDYFNHADELTDIIWRFVICRTTRLTLPLGSMETRMTPLLTPGDTGVGTFWAYQLTQYTTSFYYRVLSCCVRDSIMHQPNHKYAFFQANAYVDGVYADPQPDIDEIALLAEFATAVSGTVELTGYGVNLNRLMYDIFSGIANDIGKLSIRQSTLTTFSLGMSYSTYVSRKGLSAYPLLTLMMY